jgi:hypothetical protein
MTPYPFIKRYSHERVAGAEERGAEFDKIIDSSLRGNKTYDLGVCQVTLAIWETNIP